MTVAKISEKTLAFCRLQDQASDMVIEVESRDWPRWLKDQTIDGIRDRLCKNLAKLEAM